MTPSYPVSKSGFKIPDTRQEICYAINSWDGVELYSLKKMKSTSLTKHHNCRKAIREFRLGPTYIKDLAAKPQGFFLQENPSAGIWSELTTASLQGGGIRQADEALLIDASFKSKTHEIIVCEQVLVLFLSGRTVYGHFTIIFPKCLLGYECPKYLWSTFEQSLGPTGLWVCGSTRKAQTSAVIHSPISPTTSRSSAEGREGVFDYPLDVS